MAIYEDQLERWARGPATTEAAQCGNTVALLTRIIRPQYGLSVSILPQGSYGNRTNVRRESDVDVIVRHDDNYYSDVDRMTPEGRAQYWANLSASTLSYEDFKQQVYNVLRDALGADRVRRRNKCIFVGETASGVNADVVPCFVLKRFRADGRSVEAEGIQFRSDDGPLVNSFPEQHYANGVAKNDRTRRMFKRTVRILKIIRGALVDEGRLQENDMSSFFIECLVYNASDSAFNAPTYREALRQVIADLWAGTESGAEVRYVEVCGLKWLFRDGKTVAQARGFLQAAWNYIGY